MLMEKDIRKEYKYSSIYSLIIIVVKLNFQILGSFLSLVEIFV